jgi:outer membrane protein
VDEEWKTSGEPHGLWCRVGLRVLDFQAGKRESGIFVLRASQRYRQVGRSDTTTGAKVLQRRQPCGVVMALFMMLALAGVITATAAVRNANAESLNEALNSAYYYNPRIDAERARLRASDEDVARAMSGYRPTVTGSADVNYQKQTFTPPGTTNVTHPRGYRIDFSQPIFSGFRTRNAVSESEANVRAARETLRRVEQEVLLDAVTAFMDVLRDQAIVRINERNVRVLSNELNATQQRFSVGEVTKTDTAQARARRAGAVSQLDLARANLKTSRANFRQVVGHAPNGLVRPSNLNRNIPGSLDAAIGTAMQENPDVVAALFREQAASFTIGRIRGELLPSVQFEASHSDRWGQAGGGASAQFGGGNFGDEVETTTVTGRLTVPFYQGGEVHARVRQAKHLHISFIQEIEQARVAARAAVVAAWSQWEAAQAQETSARTQVEASRIALAGVREEERVGQRDVLDVLNAEQEYLNAQIQLEQTRRNVIVNGYAVLSAIGRLDALTLGAAGTVYDPEAHYHEVRRKWWGVSITHADGRREHLQLDPDGDYSGAK